MDTSRSAVKEKIHFVSKYALDCQVLWGIHRRSSVSKCSSPSIRHNLSPDLASSVLGHCKRSAMRPDYLGLYLSPALYLPPLVSYLPSLALFPHLLNRAHNSTPQGVVRMNKLIHLECLDSEGQQPFQRLTS